MEHLPFFIITGGPGAGKTTLLNALSGRNIRCVPEDARTIIKQEIRDGGNALPWGDKGKYLNLMLKRSVESYNQALLSPELTFFDRGIPDVLCYASLIGSANLQAVLDATKQCRYHSSAFFLPPWAEIYTTDAERKQNWPEVLETYRVMKETYSGCGYNIIEVPPLPINERVDFVINDLNDLHPFR